MGREFDGCMETRSTVLCIAACVFLKRIQAVVRVTARVYGSWSCPHAYTNGCRPRRYVWKT